MCDGYQALLNRILATVLVLHSLVPVALATAEPEIPYEGRASCDTRNGAFVPWDLW
jgi:hypothetical protein